jgi:hypothetical protein
MNDFVKISKSLTDERPDFSYCDERTFFSSGENCNLRGYKLKKEHTEIDIRLNESTGKINVKGNIGMFWNGHNIDLSNSDFNDAISFVSDRINVDLFPANVEEMDHSATIKTKLKPKQIIYNHLSLPGHLTHYYKDGKYFIKQGSEKVKMYDAGMRMKQMLTRSIREGIYGAHDIDRSTNLLRFESKYLKPRIYFKRDILVNDLLQPEFINQCNIALMETYNKIIKTGCLQIPKNKKYLSSAILPLIEVKELEAVYGFDFADLLKKRISAIDETILNKEDKKARKRQISANLKKISGKVVSEYDISKQLAESLKMTL